MMITCPKCGYVRQPQDTVPDYQCPKCQITYEKYLTIQKRQVALTEQQKSEVIGSAPGGMPLFNKMTFLMGLAIILDIFFSISKILSSILNLLVTYAIPHFITVVAGILCALLPAWLLVRSHNLWSKLPNIKKTIYLLAIGVILYIVGYSILYFKFYFVGFHIPSLLMVAGGIMILFLWTKLIIVNVDIQG